MDSNLATEKDGDSETAQPQSSYRFNTEELRVLRQCNRESFYQRSLPLSTVMSIGTFYAVKFGYLRNHPRFGPTPKVLIAATFGYFLGKFSYQSKCAEKLMQLPNSPLGEMLRQRKRQYGGLEETFPDQSPLSWPEMDSAAGAASQALDSERPVADGFDSYRPLDPPSFQEETILTVPSHTTSYEELRRKNREEFEHKKPKPYRGSSSDDRLVSSSPTDSDSMGLQRAKNKYGDVWEE